MWCTNSLIALSEFINQGQYLPLGNDAARVFFLLLFWMKIYFPHPWLLVYFSVIIFAQFLRIFMARSGRVTLYPSLHRAARDISDTSRKWEDM